MKIILKHIFSGIVILFLFAPMVISATPMIIDPGQIPPIDPGQVPPAPTPVAFNIVIKNPFAGGNSLEEFIKKAINDIVLPIGGVIAVLMIMYAGFLFVTAGGEPAKITKAKDALLYAAIGAAILLGAWVISEAIGGTIKELKK